MGWRKGEGEKETCVLEREREIGLTQGEGEKRTAVGLHHLRVRCCSRQTPIYKRLKQKHKHHNMLTYILCIVTLESNILPRTS